MLLTDLAAAHPGLQPFPLLSEAERRLWVPPIIELGMLLKELPEDFVCRNSGAEVQVWIERNLTLDIHGLQVPLVDAAEQPIELDFRVASAACANLFHQRAGSSRCARAGRRLNPDAFTERLLRIDP